MALSRQIWWLVACGLLLAAPAQSAAVRKEQVQARARQAIGISEPTAPIAIVHNGHPALEWKGPGDLGVFISYTRDGGEEALDFTVTHFHGLNAVTPGHLDVTTKGVVWKPEPEAKSKDVPFTFLRSEIMAPTHGSDNFRAGSRNYAFFAAFEDARGEEYISGSRRYCEDHGLRGKKACKRFWGDLGGSAGFLPLPDQFDLAVYHFQSALQGFETATSNLSVPLQPTQAAAIRNKEAAGNAAVGSGKFYDALQDYMAAWQALPAHWAGAYEKPLRQKIIKLVLRMNPKPAIPQDAMRHEAFAMTAFQESTGPQDLARAAGELRKALHLAPWWGDAYKNLGLLLEKTGQFDAAASNLQLYLSAEPNAPDAKSLQMKIYSLQYEAQHPPYIGILIGNVTAGLAKQLSLPDTAGACVQQVESGGQAAQAGVKQGDIIRTFNGQEVDNYPALIQMIRTTRAGTTVNLGIVRDGKSITLPVQVAARP